MRYRWRVQSEFFFVLKITAHQIKIVARLRYLSFSREHRFWCTQRNALIAHTPIQTNKKSPMVAKMGGKAPIGLRSAHSNRKGSRHRLTLQAKEILEGWLAKHWLNPYPTEEDKFYLAHACKITVSQVSE